MFGVCTLGVTQLLASQILKPQILLHIPYVIIVLNICWWCVFLKVVRLVYLDSNSCLTVCHVLSERQGYFFFVVCEIVISIDIVIVNYIGSSSVSSISELFCS